MAEVSTGKRSYLAMGLSTLLPGLGQFYLRKPFQGFILFLGVISAGAIIYMNSVPVNSWRDLTRLDGFEKRWAERRAEKKGGINSDGSVVSGVKPPTTSGKNPLTADENKNADYHLYTFEDGKKLMFRPSWKFKVSGFIQGVVFWMYAIFDGWLGRKGFDNRPLKKRLKAAEAQRKAAERTLE
jgi:hypothetical protein